MNKRVATIGLGAFLLADIVLVALALRPPPVTPEASVSPASTRSTAGASGATAPTAGATAPTTGAPKAGSAVPVQRMVAGVDAKNAWRGSMGTCDGGGSALQVTTDGGNTWTDATSPSKAMARIQPLKGGVGFVYAAGANCTLEEWTTKDNGTTWAGPKTIVGGWTRQIAEPGVVVTPKDPASQPCGGQPVLDLSRVSTDQAEALCANGDVVVTTDGGSSWGDSGKAPGAVALTDRLEGTVLSTYAARVEASCAGVQIVKVVFGKPAAPVACVETTAPPQAGQVGISVSGSAAWLVVGDKTWVAGVDLKDWSPA